MVAQRYLKKWLGIPSRGCTSAGIFSPLLLGVKPVSQVYMEGHMSAYLNSNMLADEDTKEALRNAEERESEWVRKSSTILQCKEMMAEMENEDECTIPTPENCANFAVTSRVEKPKVMLVGKKKVASIFQKQSSEEVAKLGMQGELLALLDQEKEDIAWKATIYRVPRGMMAWAVRACTNTLATPDNLARWGKPVDTKCHMEGCNAISTLGHLLSCCPKALDRFKFRHDSVLSHLLTTIVKHKKEEVTVYADLNGWRVNGGTLPPDMVLTEQIPDLVIIDKSETPTKVILVELTVPWDSSNSFQAALERKTARYERLAGDLREGGYTTSNLPLEIGCRGVISARNSLVMETICNIIKIPSKQKLKGALGRIALQGSYRIWLARRSQEWSGGELIKVT